MATTESQPLDELIETTLSLLSRFSAQDAASATAASSSSSSSSSNKSGNDSPLHVLRDAAKLLKAHVTKLSLLAINKPYTPSAVRKVLQELTATCLPALMFAAQTCAQQKGVWSETMANEVERRVRAVFDEMQGFLRELQALSGRSGPNNPTGRDSLSSTGVVWAQCDALVELETLGISGLVVRRAASFRDTIRDAIEELEEWRDGEALETEGKEELLESDDEGVDGDNFEDLFHAANSMPKDRPGFAKLVDEAVGKLKKIVLFYNAVEKRRLKTFTDSPEGGETRAPAVERLDKAMQVMENIPHAIDNLVGAFYELEEERAHELLSQLLVQAKDAAALMRSNWENQSDQFSEWSQKWIQVVG